MGQTSQTTERPTGAAKEDIARIVREVFALWLDGHGSAKVTCAFDINTGPCCEFADHVVEVVLERFPGTEIEVEDYEDYLRLDGLTSQGIHYYVKAGGCYFDASERDGVHSPDVLPTCHSLRICASSVDEDEDEDDEEPSSECRA